VSARGLCARHYVRWHRANPDAVKRMHRRRHAPLCLVVGCGQPTVDRGLCRPHQRFALHHLSVETINRLAEVVDCSICGSCLPLVVDHVHGICTDHPAKRACDRCDRGMLCDRCNLGIGCLGDDADRVMAAAAYLLESRPGDASIRDSASMMLE
jgi:hypothetical protein